MELLIIFLLILLNGVFAMSEMALVSSRKFKLEIDKKKGSENAKTALELSEKPTKFLSTVQIGITLIGILLGVYSGEALTNDVVKILNKVAFLKPYSDSVATGLIVVIITYFSIVLGELFPKRIGMIFPESIIKFFAKPMIYLSIITSPFVWLLSHSNDLLARIFGFNNFNQEAVTEAEIKEILKDSAQSGEIQEIEMDIAERVFQLDDKKVNSILTHRNDIVFFTLSDSWEDIQKKINKAKHSAYPVSESDTIDDFIGIVLLKDLFCHNTGEQFNLTEHIVKPIVFKEDTYAFEVLVAFRKEKLHYGIVVDEFGILEGMITMDDIMDSIIGHSPEYYHVQHQIIKKNENSWIVEGQFKLLEFAEYFDINLPEEIHTKFTTITGLFIQESSTVPEVGDKLRIKKYELEIIHKIGQRIDKILVTRQRDR